MNDALTALRDRYLRAQLSGSRREAVRLVIEEGRALGATVTELQTLVIAAAQTELGRLWERNRITVAQEYTASAISQVALAALFEQAVAPAPLGKTIVIACVEGEQHDLPSRIVADALELEGFTVAFLGADVAHADLAGIIRESRADLVGLSTTMTFNVASLRLAMAKVRAATDAPIFVGGHALEGSLGLARDLGAAPAGSSLAEVIATARRLTKIDR